MEKNVFSLQWPRALERLLPLFSLFINYGKPKRRRRFFLLLIVICWLIRHSQILTERWIRMLVIDLNLRKRNGLKDVIFILGFIKVLLEAMMKMNQPRKENLIVL